MNLKLLLNIISTLLIFILLIYYIYTENAVSYYRSKYLECEMQKRNILNYINISFAIQ